MSTMTNFGRRGRMVGVTQIRWWGRQIWHGCSRWRSKRTVAENYQGGDDLLFLAERERGGGHAERERGCKIKFHGFLFW